MKSFITSIGTALPEHGFDQILIAEFMATHAGMDSTERKKLMALYKASGIRKRYSVIPDFGNSREHFQFFPPTETLEPFPSVSQRMKLYEQHALPLSLASIQKCLDQSGCAREEITHLITVSCTGMYAPGLDIEITQALKLTKNIQRTCINFMGCYAAFNALKMADTICRSDENAKVLIVCVELCTIHYQKRKDWDYILSNALFGDGAAAALIETKPTTQTSFALESFHCDIEFSGKQDMAWNISDFGFEMVLSSYIPELIRKGIQKLSENALLSAGLDDKDIDYYAIHPGGKKILEVIEEELRITDRKKTSASYEVLREYGNMSSPTILFVLERILHNLTPEDNHKKLLGFAFGPGLTMESAVMKVCSFKENPKVVSSNEEILSSENIL